MIEAAFAGALGVELGGEVSYGGVTEQRPRLNHGARSVQPHDIIRAVRLMLAMTLLATGLSAWVIATL
jgi:adenosylcobinamide-phosphate synthase